MKRPRCRVYIYIIVEDAIEGTPCIPDRRICKVGNWKEAAMMSVFYEFCK